MKVEGYLFLGCAVFFAVMDVIYWHFSHDPTGTTALALAVGLAFLTGFYVLFTGRRLPLRGWREQMLPQREQGRQSASNVAPLFCYLGYVGRFRDHSRSGCRVGECRRRPRLVALAEAGRRRQVLPLMAD